MLFTVAGLKDEEDDPIVEPDVPMRDDGCEGRFAKAYIHDEIPWMDLRHEVRDLMYLAVPDIAVPEDELSFQDELMPDDGMEASWAVVPEVQEESAPAVSVPVFPTAISAPVGSAMIAAPAAVHMISMPAEVPEEAEPEAEERTLAISAASETAMIQAPVAVPSLPEPVLIAEEIPEEVQVTEVVEDVPVTDIPAEPPEVEEVVETEIPIAEVVEETAVEAMDIPEVEAVGEITMTVPEELETEVQAPVMEESPAVRFFFGSQEVRGSGWRVCFSF